jgi:hypothetical protein
VPKKVTVSFAETYIVAVGEAILDTTDRTLTVYNDIGHVIVNWDNALYYQLVDVPEGYEADE